MIVNTILFFTIFPSLSIFGINVSLLIASVLLPYVIILKSNHYLIFNKLIFVLVMLFAYAFFSLLSSFINGVLDISFVKYIVIDLIALINIYCILRIVPCTVDEILSKFVGIIVFQIFIGIVFYFFPSLGLSLNAFFVKDPTAFKIIEHVLTLIPNRLVGLGFAFFGASTQIIVALLASAYLYKKKRERSQLINLFFLVFIGFFFGRTVMIGVFLILFLLPLKGALKISGLGFVCIMVFARILEEYNPTLYKWAFEIFFNLAEGKIGNGSTDGMVAFYQIVPTTMKTWLVGDGLFSDGAGGYYMGTDIGHMRQIFYIGLLGWCVLVLYKITLTLKVVLSADNIDLIKLALLIFMADLILNFKGITNLNYIFFMIIIAQICSNNKKRALIKGDVYHAHTNYGFLR